MMLLWLHLCLFLYSSASSSVQTMSKYSRRKGKANPRPPSPPSPLSSKVEAETLAKDVLELLSEVLLVGLSGEFQLETNMAHLGSVLANTGTMSFMQRLWTRMYYLGHYLCERGVCVCMGVVCVSYYMWKPMCFFFFFFFFFFHL